MAGLIPKSFIDELVGRADIVELIGARVALKKAGKEFKGCCPFHDEKTASFYVIPDKQFYHCFGCGAHGTAIGFLMNYDHMPFVDAVEELASRLGIEVPREAGSAPTRNTDDDLYSLTKDVAAHYSRELTRNARARDYVERRGLEAATLERFQIGYAANSWNDVLNRFGKDDAARRRLAESGLIIERSGASERGAESRDRWYDRFRDRVMFPIRDVRGRVIAFGGRIIDQGEPKYMNSPETTLFHKGRELYGLYEVRQNRAPLRRLLIVEGYMDVVRLHQAGITYAVATLGTATTAEHLARAFRMVSEVVFSFDGDRAGRSAAWRAAGNVLPEARAGREIKFLFLPDGEDPDSLVGREGAAAFEARLAAAVPLSEYLVAHLLAEVDATHADGKAKLLALAAPLLERVPPGVYRELLRDRLAQALGMSVQRLEQVLAAGAAAAAKPGQAAPQPSFERRPAPPPRAPVSAGRGGIVRQSVQNLLHYPGIALHVKPALRALLEGIDEPGAGLLRELLDELRLAPAANTAQVLERWRERPEHDWLLRLSMADALAPDAAAAGPELVTALEKLAGRASLHRLDALLARADDLNDTEKQELQQLMAHRADAMRDAAGAAAARKG